MIVTALDFLTFYVCVPFHFFPTVVPTNNENQESTTKLRFKKALARQGKRKAAIGTQSYFFCLYQGNRNSA